VPRHKLQRAVRATGKSAQRLLQEYEAIARIVKPGGLPARVSRDPDDDAVLACAVAARADFIVTGDKDLLGLRAYRAIAILSASEALDKILQRP
jgi:putative PIN family toxin of toxin-antitoxin system